MGTGGLGEGRESYLTLRCKSRGAQGQRVRRGCRGRLRVGTQTRAHKKQLEQGAHVPSQGDLTGFEIYWQTGSLPGLASTLAAVRGLGRLNLPEVGECSPITC